MAEKETKGLIDTGLLKRVKSDTEEILNRVGNHGLGQRIETAQNNIIERIGKIPTGNEAITQALIRIERRQGEMIEALLVLLTNQGSPDPTKIRELTDKLNSSAQSLNASVEANKP